jgi:hypothetical protein
MGILAQRNKIKEYNKGIKIKKPYNQGLHLVPIILETLTFG